MPTVIGHTYCTIDSVGPLHGQSGFTLTVGGLADSTDDMPPPPTHVVVTFSGAMNFTQDVPVRGGGWSLSTQITQEGQIRISAPAGVGAVRDITVSFDKTSC